MIDSIYIEIKEIALFLQSKGWAERNAGNFSYRIDHETILISCSGSKFRDMAIAPERHCCVVQGGCEDWRVISDDIQAEQILKSPSSEIPTHLLIHQYLSKHNPHKKAVIHTHPTHLIAFSHKYYDFPKDEQNRILRSIMPEVGMFIPAGTGFVDLLAPGSDDLATATMNELLYHDIVIWKKHGCIAVADTLWNAVDMIDITDKAAYIALLAGIGSC
jgi:rhamnulose-1-phosphate aldolase